MKTFLDELAAELTAKYDHLGDVCVVFQNRRASLFFKLALKQTLAQSSWMPDVYAIEDFNQVVSGIREADALQALFELYSCYQAAGGSDSFEQFVPWGEMLLKDFNDIDHDLADVQSLFGSLDKVKAMERWSPDSEDVTPFQTQFLNFWGLLAPMYESLQQKLRERHQSLAGRIAREVAENIDDFLARHQWEKIIFAGFNALTAAEEKLFKTLTKNNRADIFWDVDNYYLNNELQEAGNSIRRYVKTWIPPDWKFRSERLIKETKDVEIIGAAKKAVQAKVAGNIIRQWLEEGKKPATIAVVLADESLLLPLLHSMPESVESVNISMGLSLRSTPLYDLISHVFQLQTTTGKQNQSRHSFYYLDILRLLAHPFVQNLFKNRSLIQECKTRILKENIVFVSNEMKELEPIGFLLSQWENTNHAISTFKELLQKLSADASMGVIELEILTEFGNIVNRLEALISAFGVDIGVKGFQNLLSGALNSTRLSFSGEPLEGIQIMGVLETRSLDFENLIVVSANENILPSAKVNHSLVPFDLRKGFGLSTYLDKDAIYAYNFYRLLQRAVSIRLVYDTEPNELGEGEQSRFITQLLHEWPKINPNVRIVQRLVTLPAQSTSSPAHPRHAITVHKDEATLEILDRYFEKGVSPSALNKFIACSLQFYFRYIAHLLPPEEVEETIEPDIFGNAVHAVLATMYESCLGRNLTTDDIEPMLKMTEPRVTEAYKSLLHEDSLDSGKNRLLIDVSVNIIKEFLNNEKARVQKESVSVLELEKTFTRMITVSSNGHEKSIRLNGKLDRVEKSGDLIRIVDYKTGKPEENLNVDDFKKLEELHDQSIKRQLLFYAYVLAGEKQLAAMESGVYFFREIRKGFRPLSVSKNARVELGALMEFENLLKSVLGRLIDPKTPFEQTADRTLCQLCDYATICMRDQASQEI
ncbi:PD-(D/E)XK nuclease family protein [bacterium]|nr:PD-(D/E)XK nuclease family protein [bacterium]